jgi:hypothetical protein
MFDENRIFNIFNSLKFIKKWFVCEGKSIRRITKRNIRSRRWCWHRIRLSS